MLSAGELECHAAPEINKAEGWSDASTELNSHGPPDLVQIVLRETGARAESPPWIGAPTAHCSQQVMTKERSMIKRIARVMLAQDHALKTRSYFFASTRLVQ